METEEKIPFDPALDVNRKVFDYIKNLHCHSDISDVFEEGMKPCGDVQFYSPDNYRYLTASTQNIIFAFAAGTDTIAFRLNKKMKMIAIETGGRDFSECGEDWVRFTLFRNDWPKTDLEFWSLKAYVGIREKVGLA